MGEMLKVNVTIGDRKYPLTIDPKQEEGIRKAVRKIDELVSKFEKTYAVRDKQDVLAMCALQFSSALEQAEIDHKNDHFEALLKLNKLNSLLEKTL